MVNSWGGSIGIPVLDLLPHELHNFSVINSDRHQEYPCIAWRCKENYRANPAVSDLSTLITENQHRGQVSKGIWLDSLDSQYAPTHPLYWAWAWMTCLPRGKELEEMAAFHVTASHLNPVGQDAAANTARNLGASRGSRCSWSGSGGTHAGI